MKYLITGDNIIVQFDGMMDMLTLNVGSDGFTMLRDYITQCSEPDKKIIRALGKGDETEAKAYFEAIETEKKNAILAEALNNKLASSSCELNNALAIEGGKIMYMGTEIPMQLTNTLESSLMLPEVGLPTIIVSLGKFLENLEANPSEESKKDLLTFMAASDLPITEDGMFLAYKNVGKDLYDLRSHTNIHNVGAVISMPRDKVNANRNITCSTGLHVCSKSYLSQYSGAVTVIIKINPRNVVSVPNDYNNAKMRVCEYTVDSILNQPDANSLTSGVATKKNKVKSAKKVKPAWKVPDETALDFLKGCGSLEKVEWKTAGVNYQGFKIADVPGMTDAVTIWEHVLKIHPQVAVVVKTYKVLKKIKKRTIKKDRALVFISIDDYSVKVVATSKAL